MTDDEKSTLAQLRWERERQSKQTELNSKLGLLLPVTDYSFVSCSESDRILLSSHDWPKDKWKADLYLQTEINAPDPVDETVKRLLELASSKCKGLAL